MCKNSVEQYRKWIIAIEGKKAKKQSDESRLKISSMYNHGRKKTGKLLAYYSSMERTLED